MLLKSGKSAGENTLNTCKRGDCQRDNENRKARGQNANNPSKSGFKQILTLEIIAAATYYSPRRRPTHYGLFAFFHYHLHLCCLNNTRCRRVTALIPTRDTSCDFIHCETAENQTAGLRSTIPVLARQLALLTTRLVYPQQKCLSVSIHYLATMHESTSRIPSSQTVHVSIARGSTIQSCSSPFQMFTWALDFS